MSALTLALSHYAARARLSRAVSLLATRLWGRIDPADISGSWAAQLPALLLALVAAQEAAAAQAIRDGADIAQVVNARRGAKGLTTAGGGRLTEAE